MLKDYGGYFFRNRRDSLLKVEGLRDDRIDLDLFIKLRILKNIFCSSCVHNSIDFHVLSSWSTFQVHSFYEILFPHLISVSCG